MNTQGIGSIFEMAYITYLCIQFRRENYEFLFRIILLKLIEEFYLIKCILH